MIWILMFLILQIIQLNLAAPVESMPTHLYDGLSTESNNLTKKWEEVLNSTELIFAEADHHILRNFTLNTQNQLEETTEIKPDETNFVTKTAEAEVSVDETKIFATTVQHPIKSSTNNEKVLQETTFSSNALDFQFNETSSTETPASFLTQSNENEKELRGSLAYAKNIEIEETTSLPTETNEILQQTPTFKQAVDSFIEDIMEIGDKLGFLPEKPIGVTTQMTTVILGEELKRTTDFITEKSMSKDLKQTVENVSTHSQNLTDHTLEIYNIKPEEMIDLKDTNVSNMQTTTQAFTTEPAATTIAILKSNDIKMSGKHTNNDGEHAINAEASFSTDNAMHETSNMSPALNQPIDAFIKQLSTIEQSIENSIDKVINSSSSQQVLTSELQTNTNGREPKQLPAFKQAIDAFIEDIMEVGEKLGLTGESATVKQMATSNESALNQETTTAGETKRQHDHPETPLTIFKPISDLAAEKLDQTSAHLSATTISYVEDLNETNTNIQIEVSTSPSAADTINESVMQTTFKNSIQETANIFDKTVTESYFASKITNEAAANDHQIENSTETNSSSKQSSENFVTHTLQYWQDSKANSESEDQQNLEVLSTTPDPMESTTIFQEKIHHFTTLQYNEKYEYNHTLPAQENQNKTISAREQKKLGSDFDSKQLTYQTDPYRDIEIQQLEATSTKNYVTENEALRLDDRTETTAVPLDKSTDEDDAVTATTQQVEQETSSIPISRLSLADRDEEIVHNLSTIETTQKYQPAFLTSTESLAFATESTTLAPAIETTLRTLNFETIHNSTHQPFYNMNSFVAETESPKQNPTTTETPNEQTFPVTTRVETSTTKLTSNELHENSAIRQDFSDKFAENYAEKVNTTTVSAEKELLQGLESSLSFEENTNATITDLTTALPANEKLQTLQDGGHKELLVTESTANSINAEKSSGMEQATTQYTAETTTQTNIVRVPLLKDFNSFSLNATLQADAAALPQETTTPNRDPLELSTTIENLEPKEETTILPLPENLLKEIVTFIEVTEAATKTAQLFAGKSQEYRATTETQRTETQTDLMQEQQQQRQIESTTESAAQIESTAASEQPATTTIHSATQTEQQTTEAEINSTTMLAEEYETTVTPKEPEARSLSLPPPKLEYSHSDEGVEVFYGYSSVKHN